VGSPRSTSNVLKASVTFFCSLKQHTFQTHFSFISSLSLFKCARITYGTTKLYLRHVPQSHMLHAYSKEEMTHQAVILSACSGRSCVEQLCHLMVSVGTMFCISVSLSVLQFQYILHPFTCKANLQLTQKRMAYSTLFSPDVHKVNRRRVSHCPRFVQHCLTGSFCIL
jgi:hypothetical protein